MITNGGLHIVADRFLSLIRYPLPAHAILHSFPLTFLSCATVDDLPVLAEINRLAYLSETVAQFAFTDWPAEETMRTFFTARVQERLRHSATQVWKAALPTAQGIVGLVWWTLEHTQDDLRGLSEPNATPTTAAVSQMPPGLNLELVQTGGTEVEAMKDLMQGMEHYCKWGR